MRTELVQQGCLCVVCCGTQQSDRISQQKEALHWRSSHAQCAQPYKNLATPYITLKHAQKQLLQGNCLPWHLDEAVQHM